MTFDLIIPPGFSAGGPADARAGGLGAAGAAYLGAGLVDEIAAIGGPVRRLARLDEGAADLAAVNGDPIATLGRIGNAIGMAVADTLGAGSRAIVAGGTCVALPGVLAGLQRTYGAAARIGLVWFDAHGDFNTPATTPSGMLGGMPVAASSGLCHAAWRLGAGQETPIPTDRIVMVDVRNLDPDERRLIEATDVRVVPVTGRGAGGESLGEAVTALAGEVDHLYLHVDADVLDVGLQPNHPTGEPDGPDLAEVVAALGRVFATGKVRAFGVVSVDPTGPEGQTSLGSGLSMLRQGAASWAREGAPA